MSPETYLRLSDIIIRKWRCLSKPSTNALLVVLLMSIIKLMVLHRLAISIMSLFAICFSLPTRARAFITEQPTNSQTCPG